MSEEILFQLKNSYVLIPVVVIFSIIATFIDGKVTGVQKTRNDYIKIALLVSVITGSIVFLSQKTFDFDDEILTGPPPF